MSSGVRNLRAMFEQNNAASASPEPRGRSPGSSSAADDSSRPTSKVRASFVSVEHTIPHASDFGANKGTPSNSTAAHRRESFSISEDTGGEVADLKRIISEEKEERRKSVAIIDPVPEQAVASRESSAGPPPIRNEPEGDMVNLGAIMKGSDFPETAADTGAGALQPEETPAPTPAPAPELASVKEEPVQEEAVIEEEPVEEEPLKEEPTPAPVEETPAENPDKAVTGAQEEVSLKPADPTDASAVAGGKALPSPAEELQPASTETAPAAPIEPAEPAAETPKPAASSAKLNGTPTTKGKLDVKKPAAISTTKASASKGTPAKSPLPKTAPKTPTTPKHSAAAPVSKPAATSRPAAAAAAKPAVKRAASREPPKAAAPKPKTSHTSLRASTATAPTASAKAKASATETKKPTATKPRDPTTTSPTGFKKPKPRSPTRPVGLPSRLTAPTAASAAKLQGEEAQKTTRKPATATTTTTRPAPKPAATRPPRASVAPSASTTKRPESRTSTAGAGPSFFERMMRPTAASASKVHEKPTSPPRKAPAKSSILQKGKKKVEEVASKAKEAVTSNDHTDEPAKTETTNGTSAQHEDEEKPVAEPVSEPVVEKADETEPAKAETRVPEGESSAMELQTPHLQGEAVR